MALLQNPRILHGDPHIGVCCKFCIVSPSAPPPDSCKPTSFAVSSGPSGKLLVPWPGPAVHPLAALGYIYSKLATFHVSWYMGQNNSASVEYAFSRPSKMPSRHFAFFFVVGGRRCNYFFFIVRECPGMLPDYWASQHFTDIADLLISVGFIFTYPRVMFITKASNLLLILNVPAQFTYHWYGRPNVMFCGMPRWSRSLQITLCHRARELA